MKRSFKLLLSVIVILAAVLACNMPIGDTPVDDAAPNTEVEVPSEDVQPVEESGDESEEMEADLEDEPPADDGGAEEGAEAGDGPQDMGDEGGEPTQQPPPEPTADSSDQQGYTRANPYLPSTWVTTPYMDFRVLETARGDAAWQIIVADDPDALPPPPGKEYYLVKLWVQCKNPDPGTHDIDLGDFRITGDSLKAYSDHLWDVPQPEFYYSDIYTAEEVEGWTDVLIDTSESSLILVFDREEYVEGEEPPREVRYLALDKGASISVPADLAGITPTDAGTDRENPVKLNQMVTTREWEITILEVKRGQEALDFSQQVNERTKPPEEGMEYIAFRVQTRRISSEDLPASITGSDFTSLVPGMGRNGSDYMDAPFVYLDPVDAIHLLSDTVFPGGVVEGWVINEVPDGHTPLLVEYKNVQPGLGSEFWDERYFLLEP